MDNRLLGRFIKNIKAVTVQNLGSYALAFCVAVIIVSISAQVLGQVRSTTTSAVYNTTPCADNTVVTCRVDAAYNVSGEGLEGLEAMGEWFPTIATIIAAVVIIVLIVSGFRPSLGGGFEQF